MSFLRPKARLSLRLLEYATSTNCAHCVCRTSRGTQAYYHLVRVLVIFIDERATLHDWLSSLFQQSLKIVDFPEYHGLLQTQPKPSQGFASISVMHVF